MNGNKSIASIYSFIQNEPKMIKIIILIAIALGGYKFGFLVKDIYVDMKVHTVKWIFAALSGLLSFLYAPAVAFIKSIGFHLDGSLFSDIIMYNIEGIVKAFWGVCAAVVSAVVVNKITNYRKNKKK